MSELAIFGGPKAITKDPGDMFDWPIINQEDEDAILDVLHKRAMSGTDISRAFEQDFVKWSGCKYALGFNNGTASIQAALYGCGVRRGDEVICQSLTYWATGMQVYSLGATPVFVEPDRHLAIKLLKDISGENDVLVLAGKGHENYQILADKTIYFDDRQEVQKIFKNESVHI